MSGPLNGVAGAKPATDDGWAMTARAEPASPATVWTTALGRRAARPRAAGPASATRRAGWGVCSPCQSGVSASGLGLGLQVEQRGHQVATGGTVHHRVVDLGHQGDGPVGEAVGQPRLPQRAVAAEGAAAHLAHELLELVAARVGAEVATVEVVVELEVGILDPSGMVEPSGHRDHTAPERRDEMQPLGEQGGQPLRWQGARRPDLGRVEDEHADDVQVHGRRLHLEESGIHPLHPFHHSRLRSVISHGDQLVDSLAARVWAQR